jgi:hypothetical protein
MSLKIACLGAAPSSRLLAPFNDPSWEIWACSPPNYNLPRVDAWFELHSLRRKMGMPANAPYVDLLQKHPRVYLCGGSESRQVPADPMFKSFPNAIAFPFDDMLKEFGPWFFSSTLAWMMALAITLKPDEIGLWGVDMSAHEEYGYQRAGCHRFFEHCLQRGIKVTVPPESDIMHHAPLYGLKEQSPIWWKHRTREKELKQRVAEAQAIIAQKENEVKVLSGAMDDMTYISNTYCPTRYSPNV